jgi:pyruvate dehydrogenase E1 component subunit alpha
MEIPVDKEAIVAEVGNDWLRERMRDMLLIRNFEARAEASYQQGKIGGFLHLYVGQEAIAVAAVAAIGRENWWATTYRCHAHALLLGVTPGEAMAEFFGRANGNAGGNGGSMHLYTNRLMGGSGIVGGQIPLGTGAAFAAKYLESGEIAVCFMGEGAVAQGTFHESLNLASLWSLPCIYVIENNHWGMGTAASRAIAVDHIAEKQAVGYGMEGYTVDGMDFYSCYAAFKFLHEKVKRDGKPVIVEMMTERFRGHSVSDPAVYRSKDELAHIMERDPVNLLKLDLLQRGVITEESFKELNKEERDRVVEAVKYADESPWPDVATLEEGVFAD